MKQIVKVGIVLIVLLSLLCFSGCSGNPYEAEILNDNASEIINRSFFDQNYTYGAYYNGSTSLQDPALPKSRIFVIKTQDEYNNIIAPGADLNVDFASEMIIVYTYTSDYVRDINIYDVQVIEQNLNIRLSLRKASKVCGDAVQSFQRYVVLKMKKIDFATVDVVVE